MVVDGVWLAVQEPEPQESKSMVTAGHSKADNGNLMDRFQTAFPHAISFP